MAGLLRRFKNKQQKSSEKPPIPEESTCTPDREKSSSLSPYTSDSDTSPKHLISEGSLFSGMKLTKSSRELEPETSPYTVTPTPQQLAEESQIYLNEDSIEHNEGPVFSFLTATSSDMIHSDEEPDRSSSGFSFLTNQTLVSPPPLDDDHHHVDDSASSGFAFLTADSSEKKMEDVDVEKETTSQSSGFSFLAKDPHSSVHASFGSDSAELHSGSGQTFETTSELISTMVSSSANEPSNEGVQTSPIVSASVISTSNPSTSIISASEPSASIISTSDSSASVPPSIGATSVPPMLPTAPLLPTTPSATTSTASQRVGRQALPSNKKKKKHKVVRPGQERNDEIYSSLVESSVGGDFDGLSISSHESSVVDQTSTGSGGGERGHESKGSVEMDVEGTSISGGTGDQSQSSNNRSDNTVRYNDSNNRGTQGANGSALDGVRPDKGDTSVDPVVVGPQDNGCDTARNNVSSSSGDSSDTKSISGGNPSGTGNEVTMASTSAETVHPATQKDGVDEVGVAASHPTTQKDSSVDEVGVAASGGTVYGTLVLIGEGEKDNNTVPAVTKSAATNHISSDLAGVFDHDTGDGLSREVPADVVHNYSIELSPAEKIATLLESAKSGSNAIRKTTDEVTEQYKGVFETNAGKISKLTESRNNVQELKAREAAALADEDYELAETLRQELESITIVNDRDLLINTQNTVLIRKTLRVLGGRSKGSRRQ